MIINKIIKLKNNKYQVYIDDEIYELDEESLIKFRIVLNKNIDDVILNELLIYNDMMVYYSKALNYQIKYQKSKKELYRYLEAKNLNSNSIELVITKLEEIGVVNDNKIIKQYIDSYIRKSNGINLIRNKLKEHLFDRDLIDKSLKEIDYELYNKYLDVIYNKAIKKYNNDKLSKLKVRRYLLSRGYLSFEIDELN